MSINLENLIIFALILNLLGFVVYALSNYKKSEKVKKEKKVKVPKPKKMKTPKEAVIEAVPVVKEPSEEDVSVPKTVTGEETEVERLARELKEMHEKEKSPVSETTNKGLSIEEIYGLDKEEEAEVVQLKEELHSITDAAFPQEEELKQDDIENTEHNYNVIFEENMQEEANEAKGLTEEPMPIKAEKEVSYSISKDYQEKADKEEGVEKEYVEPKREMIDALDILEVEGADEEEEEEEDVQSEIVVRHYEPLAYQSEVEEEASVEEEEDEEAAIKRRIAYLTGEWTDDYIIQPKNKDSDK